MFLPSDGWVEHGDRGPLLFLLSLLFRKKRFNLCERSSILGPEDLTHFRGYRYGRSKTVNPQGSGFWRNGRRREITLRIVSQSGREYVRGVGSVCRMSSFSRVVQWIFLPRYRRKNFYLWLCLVVLIPLMIDDVFRLRGLFVLICCGLLCLC